MPSFDIIVNDSGVLDKISDSNNNRSRVFDLFYDKLKQNGILVLQEVFSNYDEVYGDKFDDEERGAAFKKLGKIVMMNTEEKKIKVHEFKFLNKFTALSEISVPIILEDYFEKVIY